MKRITIVIFTFLLILTSKTTLFSQNTINLNIKNINEDKVMIAYYLGDKQYLLKNEITGSNNILLDKNGVGTFKSNKLKKGLLMLVFPPKNDHVNFLYDGKDLNISLDRNQIEKSISFKNSKTNKLLNDYTLFISNLTIEKNKIFTQQQKGVNDEFISKELKKLDLKYEKHFESLLKKNKNSLALKFLKANKDIKVPSSLNSQKEQFNYYKKNYFNNLNFDDEWLIRTPFFYNKVMFYVDKLTPQDINSITKSIDFIIGLSEKNPEMYKFLVTTFLNKYAKSKLMISENIYAHIVKEYYVSGKATWIEANQLNKILVSYNEIKNSLIGEKVVDFSLINGKNKTYNLYSLKSDYKILYFWTPPFNQNNLKELKKEIPNNVELLSISKGFNIQKRDDFLAKYPQKFPLSILKEEDKLKIFKSLHIKKNSTNPTIFLLDTTNKIIAKRISLEQCIDFINNLEK
ncbi:DUF5106 domain-containing protein [Polaribacter sp. MSW13]|uniref:DUF5106 domain-containing protein n=1 Tax=Polaribacter marinus TaxID=2916838 RepID=A0A9X1VM34_9FLAO|nr:DUF5106 domain-containing protein [Polaribacter marinus]MCI2228483.1 DUF5106 domain-containing protein [Polaribacter marinus]